MTLAGKILTMLTLVLSILFAGFSVVVYATHKNWRAAHAALQSQNQKLDASNKGLMSQIESYKEMLTRERIARKIVLAGLNTDLAVATEQAQTTQAENTTLQATLGQATQKGLIDTNLLNTYTTENLALRDSWQKELASRDTIFSSYVSIVDNLHELQGTHSNLLVRNQVLAETNARYQDTIDRLGPAATAAQELPLPMDGIVVAVGDRKLIEVSLGADDGLRVGHTLDVFRKGGTYLGRVVVRKTLPDRSVAEILPEFEKGQIRTQDRVATRFIN